jgi:hypothetical protein
MTFSTRPLGPLHPSSRALVLSTSFPIHPHPTTAYQPYYCEARLYSPFILPSTLRMQGPLVTCLLDVIATPFSGKYPKLLCMLVVCKGSMFLRNDSNFCLTKEHHFENLKPNKLTSSAYETKDKISSGSLAHTVRSHFIEDVFLKTHR